MCGVRLDVRGEATNSRFPKYANLRTVVRRFEPVRCRRETATAWPPCSCQCSAWRRNGGQCVAYVCLLLLAGLSRRKPGDPVPGQAAAWWCLCLARPQPGGACAWPGRSLVVPVPGQASAWWCLPQCVITDRHVNYYFHRVGIEWENKISGPAFLRRAS